MKGQLLRRVSVAALCAALCLGSTACYTEEVVVVNPTATGTDGTEPTSIVVTDAPDSTGTDSTTAGETPAEPVTGTQTNGGGAKPTSPKPTAAPTTRPTGQKPVKGDLILVENGKATADIVIAKKASEKVQEAAEDLQDYLRKITGATVSIVTDDKDCSKGNHILVGPSAYTRKMGIKTPTGYPGVERTILKRADNYLALLGNDDGNYNGTQFAVTAFLERLGCGWFGPKTLWQVVPSYKTVAVDKLDVNHTPKFTSRMNNGVYNSYKPVAERWYMGGDNLMTGHGLTALVPKSEFNKHPDWFSLIKGKRTCDVPWFQYCYSNEELAQRMGEEIIKYFDANPTMVSYPIAQNDGWDGNWCECSECSKYPNRSDLMIVFANRVAKVVAKKYPDKKLQLLSYHATLLKPSKPMHVEPNVEIMFCTEGYNITAPANTNKFRKGYDSISHNKFTQSWKDNYEDYIRLTDAKHTSIWKWYCITAENDEWKDVPWVQGNMAIEDQNYWKSTGADYVFYDHGPLPAYREGSSSFVLRWPLWYVAAKGSWDASLTGDDILADACQKLFGKAGDAMLGYYQALANASAACEGYSILWIPPAVKDMYTPTQVKKIDAAVANAKALRSQLTADQQKRMDETFAYWSKTKDIL